MALIRFEPSHPRFCPGSQPVRVGFDPNGPWQMVPYQGTRFLHLSVAGVESWSVESANPVIASVSRVDQPGGVDQVLNNVVRVDGLHHGRTFLIARGPKRQQLGRIEIEVKHQLKRFIRFFLVSDNAGHTTSFTDADTKEWTDFINDEVFTPQVNAYFQHLSTESIKINEDIGDPIDFASIGLTPFVKREGDAGRIWHIITDSGMLQPEVFNVFCLWDFVNESIEGKNHAAFVAAKVCTTAEEMVNSGVNYNMCMLKENIRDQSAFKSILAHEAGHFLNRLPAHTEGEELLMTPGAGGLLLRKSDAMSMNPTHG